MYDLANPSLSTRTLKHEEDKVRAILDVLRSRKPGGKRYSTSTQAEEIQRITGLSYQAVLQALGISNQSALKPHSRIGNYSVDVADSNVRAVLNSARQREEYFRAAYLLHAAKRIDGSLKAGKPTRVALTEESLMYNRHKNARNNRLNTVAATAEAAGKFGPLLGWYLNPSLNNDSECIAANGNNFHAAEGTVIGWPGSVHPRCGCMAGPPHTFGGMVNTAVRHFTDTHHGQARLFRIKKAS